MKRCRVYAAGRAISKAMGCAAAVKKARKYSKTSRRLVCARAPRSAGSCFVRGRARRAGGW